MSGQVLNPSHESLEMDVEELQLAKRQGSSAAQLQAAGAGGIARAGSWRAGGPVDSTSA